LLHGLDPKRAELYKICTQRQIGITVMKAFGGGKLLSPEHSPYGKPMTTNQCISYALTRPAVSSVLLGCQSIEEMRTTLNYLNATDAEKDYTWVLNSVTNNFKGHCVYCNHCQPCPVEIDIAMVHKYLDIARLDKENISPSIKSHYQNLKHKGDECIKCGHCEERCPFDVPVIRNMEEAAALL